MDLMAEQWKHRRSRPLHRAPTFTKEGLMVGHGTVLVQSKSGCLDPVEIERATCLLSIGSRTVQSVGVLSQIQKACTCWNRGDRALAHVHLAHAQIARIEGPEDAWRLFLAETLLDTGVSPAALTTELGLDRRRSQIVKYDPDQPRVPAGSGQESGRWTDGSSSLSEPVVAFVNAVPASGLADTLAPNAIAWLARLASRFSLPVALFGAVFIPSPSGRQSTEGTVPGRPDLRYQIDYQTGTLRLFAPDDPDLSHAIVAQLGQGGIYRDVTNGRPIARAVNGDDVIIDAEGMPDARKDSEADDRERPPRLCPAPVQDRLTGRMAFDIAYEQYVRELNNPQRIPQLPPELTFALPGEGRDGNLVYFDDCRELDGTMIEAKGNYAEFLSSSFGVERTTEDWTDQARRQIGASQGRRLEWYFNDEAGWDLATKIFEKRGWSNQIHTYLRPYPGGMPSHNPRVR